MFKHIVLWELVSVYRLSMILNLDFFFADSNSKQTIVTIIIVRRNEIEEIICTIIFALSNLQGI